MPRPPPHSTYHLPIYAVVNRASLRKMTSRPSRPPFLPRASASRPTAAAVAAHGLFLFALFTAAIAGDGDALDQLLGVLSAPSAQEDVPFRDVIRLATGREILPLNPEATPDRAILDAVSSALSESIARLNLPESPVRAETRINEVSRHFELALLDSIGRLPGFSCARPATASGGAQSSGYPDLLIRHLPSGRVAYLDPKLFHSGSLESSLRTFYFTPRGDTNKILHDAHHLLAGIEHDGQVGKWAFTGWKLVDLHGFRVRLKAEYQAANRDLYREGMILRTSRPESPPAPRPSVSSGEARSRLGENDDPW